MKNNTIKISIIVPMYNVEKYIFQCLESLIRQSLDGIEVIIINDSSTDNSYNIAYEFTKKYNNISIYNIPKSNYGTAVNCGLRLAKGEYIQIVEPDDYISDDYCLILYNEAREFDCDICGVASYCEFDEISQMTKLIYTYYSRSIYMNTDEKNNFLGYGSPGITLKIYKKTFLIDNNLFLDETVQTSHDLSWVPLAILLAEKVHIFEGFGYFYRRHMNQSIRRVERITNAITILNTLLERSIQQGLFQKYKSGLAGYLLAHYRQHLNWANSHQNDILVYIFTDKIKNILHDVEVVTSRKLHINFIKQNYNKKIIEIENPYISTINLINFFELRQNGETVSAQLALLYANIYYALETKIPETIINAAIQTVRFINYIDTKSTQIYNFLKKSIFDYHDIFIKKDRNSFLKSCYILINYSQYAHQIQQFLNIKNINLDNICKEYGDIVIYNNKYNTRFTEYEKQNESRFIDCIHGRSVAIVGNGPCELGYNKGEEIDSHDIVIRFNNYKLGLEHSSDYGSKIDCWAISPSLESIVDFSNVYNVNFLMTIDAPLYLGSPRYLFYNSLRTLNINFFRIHAKPLNMLTNIQIPSLGLYVIYYIVKNISCTGYVHLYGFSPLVCEKENRHYFQGDPAITKNMKFHRWRQEFSWLNVFSEIIHNHNKRLG